MRALRLVDTESSALVGLGARVLLLASQQAEAATLGGLLGGFGGRVEHDREMYSALSSVIDDPRDWDLFVIACDGLGGLEVGRRAHRILGTVAERMPTILVSEDCEEQTFPVERTEPILLRSRMSAAAMRLGMEHALRGKMAWHLA